MSTIFDLRGLFHKQMRKICVLDTFILELSHLISARFFLFECSGILCFSSFTQDLNCIQNSGNTSTGGVTILVTQAWFEWFNIDCRVGQNYWFHFINRTFSGLGFMSLTVEPYLLRGCCGEKGQITTQLLNEKIFDL